MAKNEEDRLCCAVRKWLELQHPAAEPLFIHVPNGGHRNKVVAGLFKRMGVRPGVPDYLFAIPAGPYQSLWLEMKTETGSVSEEQKTMIPLLRSVGHFVVVAYGYDEAIEILDHWVDDNIEALRWRLGYLTKSERNKLIKARTLT